MFCSSQAVCRRWCSPSWQPHRPHRHARQLPAARHRLHWLSRLNRTGSWCRSMAQQGSLQDGDQVMREVEESAKVIDEMVAEVTRELLLSAAVAHVTGDPEEATQAQLVREAVASRLESLNSTFLAVISSFAQGAAEQDNPDIAALLLAIHDEVVSAVSTKLPPEMQVLNAALQEPSGIARLELIRRQTASEAPPAGTEGGGAALPQCGLDGLERAAAQLVEEMEGIDEIPDRQLLARLVLLREEVLDMAREQAFVGGGGMRRRTSPVQRRHPRYADPSYQEAEVSVPVGQAAAAGGQGQRSADTNAQQQLGPRGKKKKGFRQQAAEEVEVEVVAVGASLDEDPLAAGEEEEACPPSELSGGEEEEGGEEEGLGPQLAFAAMGAVPRSCVAFLKEVMAVNSSEKRRSLLEKAFRTDWEGAAPSRAQQGGSGTPGDDGDAAFYESQRQRLQQLAGKGGIASAGAGARLDDLVRPGRFMQSLAVVQGELLRQAGEQAGAGAGSSVGSNAFGAAAAAQAQQASAGVLQRVEEVRREALVVLMDISGEEGSEYSP